MGNLHVVGPNEAIIVSGGWGKKGKKKTVVGGRIWAWSNVSDVQKLSLNLMTLIPKSEDVETAQGVPLTVSGVAQCKFVKDNGMLQIAAEQFLGKNIDQIKDTIKVTLEGHLRAILGTLTVEEVYKDRVKFAALVWEVAAPDVAKMGVVIISFTIRDVFDRVSYLTSLGKAQTAIVKKQADVGVAEANRDAGIKESMCEKIAMDVKYAMYSKIEDNLRKYELKKSEFNQEVNAAKAEVQLAYELQAAKIRQKIRSEEIEIDVIERRKQIEIEGEEIARKEMELAATVKLPAEAESYRLHMIAEGRRAQAVQAAIAEGEKIRMVGTAEAEVRRSVGTAQAQMMMERALVFQKYGHAAITSLILDALPKIAAEVSAPLAKTGDIVILGANDPITGGLNQLISQIPPSLGALAGIDLAKILTRSS